VLRITLVAIAIGSAASTLSACYQLGTLDGTQVETVTVDGRKFEVRVASTGVPDEYRMLIYRATVVVGPDRELEYERAANVARIYMNRTCKGRPHEQLIDTLSGVNYRTAFRCL
jgi:hypothetical protein